jgi:hypothetical protein
MAAVAMHGTHDPLVPLQWVVPPAHTRLAGAHVFPTQYPTALHSLAVVHSSPSLHVVPAILARLHAEFVGSVTMQDGCLPEGSNEHDTHEASVPLQCLLEPQGVDADANRVVLHMPLLVPVGSLHA